MNQSWDGKGYDASSDPQARWGADVVQRVPADTEGLVVDAGCGSGRVTEQLLERLPRAKVLALDASASMIAAATQRLARYEGRVTLRVHDLGAPFETPSPADAVFSTGTFHWLHDHAALFRNLRAIMRPAAMLVAQAGGRGSLDEVMTVIRRLDAPLSELNHYASVAETEAALDAAGFEPIGVWLHDEPVTFPDRDALAQFLADAALAPHLARLVASERAGFISAVAGALLAPRLDFVRLNIIARARA